LTGVAADVATAQGCAVLFGQTLDADILVNNAATAHVVSGVRTARPTTLINRFAT